jgi:hypothetical protein
VSPQLHADSVKNAPAPAGRNANGCAQKMFKTKNALRAEIDAIKNGDPIEASAPAESTPKKAASTSKTPRKHKGKADGEGDANATPSKRVRKQKGTAAEKIEDDDEPIIKPEIEDEDGVDA